MAQDATITNSDRTLYEFKTSFDWLYAFVEIGRPDLLPTLPKLEHDTISAPWTLIWKIARSLAPIRPQVLSTLPDEPIFELTPGSTRFENAVKRLESSIEKQFQTVRKTNNSASIGKTSLRQVMLDAFFDLDRAEEFIQVLACKVIFEKNYGHRTSAGGYLSHYQRGRFFQRLHRFSDSLSQSRMCERSVLQYRDYSDWCQAIYEAHAGYEWPSGAEAIGNGNIAPHLAEFPKFGGKSPQKRTLRFHRQIILQSRNHYQKQLKQSPNLLWIEAFKSTLKQNYQERVNISLWELIKRNFQESQADSFALSDLWISLVFETPDFMLSLDRLTLSKLDNSQKWEALAMVCFPDEFPYGERQSQINQFIESKVAYTLHAPEPKTGADELDDSLYSIAIPNILKLLDNSHHDQLSISSVVESEGLWENFANPTVQALWHRTVHDVSNLKWIVPFSANSSSDKGDYHMNEKSSLQPEDLHCYVPQEYGILLGEGKKQIESITTPRLEAFRRTPSTWNISLNNLLELPIKERWFALIKWVSETGRQSMALRGEPYSFAQFSPSQQKAFFEKNLQTAAKQRREWQAKTGNVNGVSYADIQNWINNVRKHLSEDIKGGGYGSFAEILGSPPRSQDWLKPLLLADFALDPPECFGDWGIALKEIEQSFTNSKAAPSGNNGTDTVRHFSQIYTSSFEIPEDWLLAFIEIGAPELYPPILETDSQEVRKEKTNRELHVIHKAQGKFLFHELFGLDTRKSTFWISPQRFNIVWNNLKSHIEDGLFRYKSVSEALERAIAEASIGKMFESGALRVDRGPSFNIEDMAFSCQEFALLLLIMQFEETKLEGYGAEGELLKWAKSLLPDVAEDDAGNNVGSNKPLSDNSMSSIFTLTALDDDILGVIKDSDKETVKSIRKLLSKNETRETTEGSIRKRLDVLESQGITKKWPKNKKENWWAVVKDCNI